MNLILITSAKPVRNEHELLVQFFELGLETLHVRKPDLSTEQLRDWVQALPDRFHDRIMLHSHHALRQEFNLKGLHFPGALRPEALKTEKGPLQFSTSFHQLSELQAPEPVFDFAFLSPVFDSISKAGYVAAFAEPEVKMALGKTPLPLMALGGVILTRLTKVRELGFSGAAVLGAVWQAPDPLQAFKALWEEGCHL